MAKLITASEINRTGFRKRLGLRIKLTRLAPRKLDSDNLAGSMKAVRDGIAEALEINDGDESAAVWEYGQMLLNRGDEVGVLVEIRGKDE